jgi:hypothetical protein
MSVYGRKEVNADLAGIFAWRNLGANANVALKTDLQVLSSARASRRELRGCVDFTFWPKAKWRATRKMSAQRGGPNMLRIAKMTLLTLMYGPAVRRKRISSNWR